MSKLSALGSGLWSRHRWPLGITMVLTLFVAVNLYLMRLAGADPSFAVEPDYYQKAVKFDSTISVERASAALGWVASSALTRGDSGTTLTVTLANAYGAPIAGATVSASARFIARANDVLTATLREVAPGRYQAPIAVKHAGQWEIRVDASRNTERFFASTRAEAAATP